MPPAAKALSERFWPKVDKSGACWTWTAARDFHGYGRFSVARGKAAQAHRVAWMLAHGPVPAGMLVLHRCDNPPCVNPSHLFVGTDGDNAADKVSKGRQLKGDAQRRATAATLRRGSASNLAVMTEAVVREARRRRSEGAQADELAREAGVSVSTMNRALAGQTWRHV